MSAIVVPPSPRLASRAQVRGRVSGRVAGRVAGKAAERPVGQSSRPAVVQTSSRARLRLVTDDFVPEVTAPHGVDDVARRPAVAPASAPTSVRRPSRPVALRKRRPDLERLAPQHPAVRAARMRDAAPAPARQESVDTPRRQQRVERVGSGLNLLRGGSFGVVAAIVLVCCGLMVGAMVGVTSLSSAASTGNTTTSTTTAVVRPGESLWEIAAASGTSDVSGMVTRIVELNDLQDTTVRAGQTLEVPAA